jgi:hypothetical protein
MDKKFLQDVFLQYSGYAYEYVGQVPEDTDYAVYVSEQFADKLNKTGLALSVVEIGNKIVLYSDEQITDSDFELITDLIPDPPVPEPEQTAEENTEEE